eukprot:CAMPEP_0118927730 /NCGR_PEP_ID=MMETSP1169-20130426/5145_1 /TAXON_ID=36882 /ORGANISM="Pyramimonas obovata, Strain CCMP722" /LENGTH=190 /DNA_ID=CAMNT_0006869559 /DNA_START=190 /DNA_END=758 /DNA_ORIENTATION=-
MSRADVDWDRLDKTRFFVNGAGLFSGVMAALYPLSVIKTRLMVLPGTPPGLKGAAHVARTVVAESGIRGLYRGFGTVALGALPTRVIYLGSLEVAKLQVHKHSAGLHLTPTTQASLDNFMGGALASLASQSVVVPIDVVSQRLMVQDAGARQSGLQLARTIVAAEGPGGLYRGFGVSLITIVPSSALWWG